MNRILQGANRMRSLIDDLLAYATARDAVIHLKPVDLQQLVADVLTERTGYLRSGLHTGEEIPMFPDVYIGPLPTVDGDLSMLRQLLDNLIGNALKYTAPGQPARISISASARADDEHITVEIADRGIGIPTDEHDHIFDTFHRAHHSEIYTGTGLGLAICRRIIERHSGSIHVTDNPGGGSRFRFTLPTASLFPASVIAPLLEAAPAHTEPAA